MWQFTSVQMGAFCGLVLKLKSCWSGYFGQKYGVIALSVRQNGAMPFKTLGSEILTALFFSSFAEQSSTWLLWASTRWNSVFCEPQE